MEFLNRVTSRQETPLTRANQVVAIAVVGGAILILVLDLDFIIYETFNLLLPLFSYICLFLAIFILASHPQWDALHTITMAIACTAGEIINNMLFPNQSHNHPLCIGVVMGCCSLAVLLTPLGPSHATTLVCGLATIRFLVTTTKQPLPEFTRPYITYACFMAAYMVSKYLESKFKLISNQTKLDEDVIMLKTKGYHNNSSTPVKGNRRISLPAIPLMKSNLQSSSGSTSKEVMDKANGLINTILAKPTELSPKIIDSLNDVKALLDRHGGPPDTPQGLNKSRTSPLAALSECTSMDMQDLEETPYIGQIHVSLPRRLRKSLPPGLIRRMSTSVWTTTTAATGLPTEEPAPKHQRNTKTAMAFNRKGCSDIGENESYVTDAVAIPSTQSQSLLVGRSFSVASFHSPSHEDSNRLNKLHTLALQGKQDSLSYDDNQDNHVNAETETKSLSLPQLVEEPDPLRKNSTSDYETDSPDPTSSDASDSRDASDGRDDGYSNCVTSAVQGQSVSLIPSTDDSNGSLLDLLDNWEFPIFDAASMFQSSLLTQVALRIFNNLGLFETFKLPAQEFRTFFLDLEAGYNNNPYHNSAHATDVLHAVYYLTTKPVPGLINIDPIVMRKTSTDIDMDALNGDFHIGTNSIGGSTGGILAGNFPALELLAIYTAAAMHDYNHPGRTNAFLVATNDPLAILYNDRSVLENHHAAASWKLLTENQSHNFIKHLDKAEYKRFRFLVLEAILATDLKKHFDLLSEFNNKMDAGSGINWLDEGDRLLVTQMCIKLADICGPSKPTAIHLNWTRRITQEFYEQGDDELNHHLVISPYMDRRSPQLAKLQDSFINHLVRPLCNSFLRANILPGKPTVSDDPNDSNPVDGNTTEGLPLTVTSPILIYLKENMALWKTRLEEENRQFELRDSVACKATSDVRFRSVTIGSEKIIKLDAINESDGEEDDNDSDKPHSEEESHLVYDCSPEEQSSKQTASSTETLCNQGASDVTAQRKRDAVERRRSDETEVRQRELTRNAIRLANENRRKSDETTYRRRSGPEKPAASFGIANQLFALEESE